MTKKKDYDWDKVVKSKYHAGEADIGEPYSEFKKRIRRNLGV